MRHKCKRSVAFIESARPDGTFALLKITYSGYPPRVHSVVQEVIGDPQGPQVDEIYPASAYGRSRIARSEAFLTDQDRDELTTVALDALNEEED